MDGLIGVEGAQLYQTEREDIKIQFLFAEENIVIIGNSEQRVLKVSSIDKRSSPIDLSKFLFVQFIRANESKLDLVHEAVYNHGPFNHQYVVDDEHESLIFAVGSEVSNDEFDHLGKFSTILKFSSCIVMRTIPVRCTTLVKVVWEVVDSMTKPVFG